MQAITYESQQSPAFSSGPTVGSKQDLHKFGLFQSASPLQAFLLSLEEIGSGTFSHPPTFRNIEFYAFCLRLGQRILHMEIYFFILNECLFSDWKLI